MSECDTQTAMVLRRDPEQGTITGKGDTPRKPPKDLKSMTMRRRWAALRAVSPSEVARVMQETLKRALNGEKWATELILAYCVGPPERLHEDRTAVDGDVEVLLREVRITRSGRRAPEIVADTPAADTPE